MLAESARLFTSSPRESLIGSPPPPPTPVDSSLCGSRGVRLSSEAPAANAGAAAFPATVKCARQAPSVNRFHHPRPFTTLVGSPLSRNPFQISGLPPTASHLTESLRIGRPTFPRTVRAWYIWSAFDSFRESGREFLERRLHFPAFVSSSMSPASTSRRSE